MDESFKSGRGLDGLDQRGPAELLTIGELAARTGVSPATLRMWEQRHGFPVPERLPSGHRRYRAVDVATVAEVVRRRDAGVRLDVAVEQALAAAGDTAPPPESVYAELRRLHPALAPHRLRKSTLIALSWAIEDEFCAKAARPHLFGAFQRREFYRSSRSRWRELARVASASFVLADGLGRDGAAAGTGPVEVGLAADSPLRREWAVVCDATALPAALTAWELPGQEGVADGDRLFESVWTVDPVAVRDAARVCAQAAAASGAADAAPVLYRLAEPVPPARVDLASVTTLFNRVVAYVDAVR